MNTARQEKFSECQFGHACNRFAALNLAEDWTTGEPVLRSLDIQRSLSSSQHSDPVYDPTLSSYPILSENSFPWL
jgi:hypothetical protein